MHPLTCLPCYAFEQAVLLGLLVLPDGGSPQAQQAALAVLEEERRVGAPGATLQALRQRLRAFAQGARLEGALGRGAASARLARCALRHAQSWWAPRCKHLPRSTSAHEAWRRLRRSLTTASFILGRQPDDGLALAEDARGRAIIRGPPAQPLQLFLSEGTAR